MDSFWCGTVTADQAVAPDGTTTMDKITMAYRNARHALPINRSISLNWPRRNSLVFSFCQRYRPAYVQYTLTGNSTAGSSTLLRFADRNDD